MSKIIFAKQLRVETFDQLKGHVSSIKDSWRDFLSNDKFTKVVERSDSILEQMTGGPGGILSRHPYFTIHGVRHSRNMIIVLNTMLGELDKNLLEGKQRLTKLEVFCMLLSAYFHDIGMFFELDEEDKELLRQCQQKDPDYTEETYIRENHHERSYRFIRKHSSIVDLLNPFDLNLKEIVAIISKGHRKNIDTKEYTTQILCGEKIRTRFLAALLGLADELDLSPERASKEFYQIYKNNMNETNKAYFLTYMDVIKSVALESKKAPWGLAQINIRIELNISSEAGEIQRKQNDYFTKLIVDHLNEEISRTNYAFREELIEVSSTRSICRTSFPEEDAKEMKEVFIASLGSQGKPRYTLDMFPERVERKWAVMIGNRRRMPEPWMYEDFFVDSSDAQDLYWIFDLGFPKDTIILGDSKEEFNKHFFSQEKRNLLIIGSPGVNLVAKKLNFDSFFRFFSQQATRQSECEFKQQYPDDRVRKAYQEYRSIQAEIEAYILSLERNSVIDIKPLRDLLVQTKRVHQEYQGIQHTISEDLIPGWKGSSISGPLQDSPVPSQLSSNEWTGLISLCIHPYCQDRMAILAAGSRFLGTICAIKKLADFEELGQRPLGGIVRLTTSTDKRGFDAHCAKYDWYTNPYTVQNALKWLRKRLIMEDAARYGYTAEEVLRLIQWLYP